MARKIYYKIVDDGRNHIKDAEWEAILRLQHWYNSEFIWTAGRLAFKMYAVFPNFEQQAINSAEQVWKKITLRRDQLLQQGLSENETIARLESEGLVIAQKGGYFDRCLASGFTRVASNEFNAYLICEFLLKASILAPRVVIKTYDEGEFIKPRQVFFSQGAVTVPLHDLKQEDYFAAMVANNHVFAVVDPAKYDQTPNFRSTISDFNELSIDERLSILKDWNWLGFENNYDLNGDDVRGFDLNRKVRSFRLEKSSDIS